MLPSRAPSSSTSPSHPTPLPSWLLYSHFAALEMETFSLPLLSLEPHQRIFPFFLHMNLSLELLGLPHSMAAGFQDGSQKSSQWVRAYQASDFILFAQVPLAKASRIAKASVQVVRDNIKAWILGLPDVYSSTLTSWTECGVEEASRKMGHTFKDSRFRGWKEHLLCLHMISDNKHIVKYYFRIKY